MQAISDWPTSQDPSASDLGLHFRSSRTSIAPTYIWTAYKINREAAQQLRVIDKPQILFPSHYTILTQLHLDTMDCSSLEHDHLAHRIPKRQIRRVGLACVPCRSRKVKCDAALPSCVRCLADEKSCEYQKSRRGGRPRRPAPGANVEPPSLREEAQVAEYRYETPTNRVGSLSSDRASSGSESTRSSTQSIADTLESGSFMKSIDLGTTRLTQMQIDQLLSQYFVFFHASHP